MKKIKILAAALAAMTISLGASAQDYDSVYASYEKAAELLGAKDYAGAIPALEQTVGDGLTVGDDALELVSAAQKLLPTAYFRLAGGLAQANNLDDALANFEKAAELGELYGDVNTARNAKGWVGRVYTAKGASAFNDKDYATAAEIFQKGYDADPTNTDLALNLAKSYAEMGNIEKAFEIYDGVIGLTHSKYADAVAQARADKGYYQTKDIADAISAKDFATANQLIDAMLETDPENPTVNMLRIQAATNQQNWNKVIANGAKTAELQETEEMKSEAYFLLGAAYQNTDNKAKAIESYRKVTAGGNVDNAKAQIAALNK